MRGCLGTRATVVARWGAGVISVLLMASCAADTGTPPLRDTPSAEPSAPSSSPPPSQADAAKQAAVAAYVGMWQAMARAGQTSDWQSPELAGFATGNALTTITRSLYADRFNKVVTRGSPVNSPVVRSVEPPDTPTRVLIEDCGDSTNWVKYDEGTDNPAGDGTGGGRRSITAEVLLQADGSWRVSRFAVQAVGTC